MLLLVRTGMDRRLRTSSAKTLVLGCVSSEKFGILGIKAVTEGNRLEGGAPSLSMEEEIHTIGGGETLPKNRGRRNKS